MLALLTALLVALPGLAETSRVRRVPPELIGAFCPTGAGSPWNTAAFATAVGTIALLGRRRRTEGPA